MISPSTIISNTLSDYIKAIPRHWKTFLRENKPTFQESPIFSRLPHVHQLRPEISAKSDLKQLVVGSKHPHSLDRWKVDSDQAQPVDEAREMEAGSQQKEKIKFNLDHHLWCECPL